MLTKIKMMAIPLLFLIFLSVRKVFEEEI